MAAVTRLMPTPGSQSLADLQTVIRQEEQAFGPLIAISPHDGNTWLTMADAAAPATPITLEKIGAGSIPDRPNHTLVCIGDCFLQGEQARVAAFRPN